jgi:type I site-specific restriction-modification system R (restriction) subunit
MLKLNIFLLRTQNLCGDKPQDPMETEPLNTLYVDKNLRHHGLIQAYSRTNRILNKRKSHGNIITFRNLKKATDEAIALFSNKDASEVILMQPYEDYIEQFTTFSFHLNYLKKMCIWFSKWARSN